MPILPGSIEPNTRRPLAAEFGIPVQYHVPLGTGQRKRLSQLLYDPLARRVRRYVEVHNATAAVLDHKQAIEHTKRQCGNGKEVKRRDHFAMVVEECCPALRFAPVISRNSICLISMRVAGSTSSSRRQVTSGYMGRNSALKATVQRQADQNQ